MDFKIGDKAYIIESSIFIKEVEIVNISGGFYLIRYPNKTGNTGYRVKASRLFKSEYDAKAFIRKKKYANQNKNY